METKTAKLNIKPFSANDAWKGRKFRTEKYDDFENEVLLLLPRGIVIPDKVPLEAWFEWGVSSMSCDDDNPRKPFQDILQKAYGFNDKWIMRSHHEKVIVPKGQEYIKFLIVPLAK